MELAEVVFLVAERFPTLGSVEEASADTCVVTIKNWDGESDSTVVLDLRAPKCREEFNQWLHSHQLESERYPPPRVVPNNRLAISVRISTRTLGINALKTAAILLPSARRADWLAEQHSYLFDLPTRRAKLCWVARELWGMPRFAYTVRTNLTTSPV